MMIQSRQDLECIRDKYLRELAGYERQILICGGGGCVSSNCAAIKTAVDGALAAHDLTAKTKVMVTGCMGTCAMGPVMLVLPERVFYTKLTSEKAAKIAESHVGRGEIVEEYTFYDEARRCHIPVIDDIDFFKQQIKIALRNCGAMDYASIEAYIARNGYFAAAGYLTNKTSACVVEEVKRSGLKGRGGAGFPTGIKWEAGLKAEGDRKFIVCNADEGDPGAFMDRSLIEGDPHSLLEAMLLGGYGIGANNGYIYVRAEYPLAIERLEQALEQARERGLLGKNILGSGFDFELEIRIGAGAFVCGEETALMNSIEGHRGEPRQKPPFPFQRGLFGCPTIINNVETLCNVPAILFNGADWYKQYGTTASPGTKVFALAGDIANTGIVEVPIGMPIGVILFDIGGGVIGDKQFKAAQMGGPSGGCITREHLNTPTDYDTIKELGAIMGSGGLIAMDEDTCMVDAARYFMEFVQDESCGTCVSCRLGTKRMLEILERICSGQGREGDIELLEKLGDTIKETAMCGLGQTAPNPVLSAIKNFREEFVEHIRHKHCRAGACADLFISPCENTCPAGINVPGYTSLVAGGRFLDAYSLIRQENPFPAVCGRVCTHPCESKCRRRTMDQAVAIRDIKRFVADYAHKHASSLVREAAFPKNGKRVSIIGAGPAGLTCGYYLARIGYDVDIYEAENIPGGVMAFGIPEYRLPNEILMYEIGLIEQEGVKIHLNTMIGRDISFEDLQRQSDAVFIATGTQKPQRINIEGEDLDGVVPGITFLKTVNLKQSVDLGKNVAVIGGGNTAIDSARTALRLGAENVYMLYRRTQEMMPAHELEITEALDEGIQLMELVNPVRIVAGPDGKVARVECVQMTLGEFDSGGRRQSAPVAGSNFMLEADTVIPAVSQTADFPFIEVKEGGKTAWGTFTVDKETHMTSEPGVFAGGDVVTGPDTVIMAIAHGKKVAASIDKYLGGRGLLNKGRHIEINPVYDDDEVVELGRYPLDMLDVERRRDSFEEVVLGYHKLTAMAEAMRCLHCERR